MEQVKLYNGDCKDVMMELDENSVDSIITDPPYGLSFMDKNWDKGIPGKEFWKNALRVIKPGGYLLSFGGTRTFHRLGVAIEDAGWEIRDTIMWVYSEGFPKSHNLKNEWQGWGTALKPAWEPIIVARKPLEGTVANNMLKYGTGAINIDDSRVGVEKIKHGNAYAGNNEGRYNWNNGLEKEWKRTESIGRWPANLIHDGGAEVLELFPNTAPSKSGGVDGWQDQYVGGKYKPIPRIGYDDSGSAARFFYCAKASKKDRNEGIGNNDHPTVKPTKLMKYLCKLVTRPNGIILDPFMGSGSTGKGAVLEGFNFIGIELEEHSYNIAKSRIEFTQKTLDRK